MTANRTLARRYATAVYSLAVDRKAVERVGTSLAALVEGIEANPIVAQFFVAPIVDRYEKERILSEVLGGRVDEIAFHTLLLLVRKHREPILRAVLEEFRSLEMAGRGVEPLTIAASHELSQRDLAALAERIEAIYGRKFEPRLVVDPELVGGLRITMGDRLIDGTVAGRLDELARALETATS